MPAVVVVRRSHAMNSYSAAARGARKQAAGFTLIELAVALVVIALLLGTLLSPLTAQVQQSRISETQKILDQINDALIGFAISQTPPRLPCPDTTGDGIEDVCPNAFATQSTGGNLPWVTLGVPATDPWGQRYQYRVNNQIGTSIPNNFQFNPSGAGLLRVCSVSACSAGTVVANNLPAVILSRGPNGAATPTSADELANTDNNGDFVGRTYSAVGSGLGEFDDIVTYISMPVLFSRLVSAQKLP